MTSKGIVTAEHLSFFESLLGKEYVITDRELLDRYAHDETADFSFLPEVALKPSTTQEISAILKLCSRDLIPVTPRGAGTGLSGGALPHLGGVVLSTERMNNILSIDERNFQVTTEPGVITQVLQDAVKEKGLFYPPDPHSRGSCFIGGNVSENSGGPKAIKYGVVKDYVINLEVVLPNGDIFWTGANVSRNATGYNLTQLLVGSEGTLGIITKIVLRLLPLPRYELLIMAPFNSIENACEAISAIFLAGYAPSAVEFMERDAIDHTLQFISGSRLDKTDELQAQLIIEVDGNDLNLLRSEMEGIVEVLSGYNCGEILFAEDASQKEALWKLRRSVGEAIKYYSVYKEQDTVVPRSELAVLLKGVKEIGRRYGFMSACCGHAGDGNLHINILKGDLTEEEWNGSIKKGVRDLFELVSRLGGTLSGEHGVGLLQKEYMDIVFNHAQLDIMRKLKKLFDPRNILNAGKIIDQLQ